jgi:hypothetical protein
MHLENFVNTSKVGKLACSLSLTSDHDNLALQAEHVKKAILCCWFDHDGGRDRLTWLVIPKLSKRGVFQCFKVVMKKSSLGEGPFKLCLWRGCGRSGGDVSIGVQAE